MKKGIKELIYKWLKKLMNKWEENYKWINNKRFNKKMT